MRSSGSMLSRLGSDLFALMIPGTYVLACIAVVWACGEPAGPTAVLRELRPALRVEWPLWVAMVAAAYLLGQTLHAVPVNFADRLWARLPPWLGSDSRGSAFVDQLHREPFPYPKTIQMVLAALERQPHVPSVAFPDRSTTDADPAHSLYNYWKLQLCAREPRLFAHTHRREARTRLYSGVVLSGLFGVALAVLAAGHAWMADTWRAWWPLLAAQAGLSMAFASIFGLQIRGIRYQEVESVFMGWLVLLDKQGGGTGRQRPRAAAPGQEPT